MLYRTRDCPYRIVSLYNSKTHSEIFKEPNRDLIRAELSALRPGDLPTAIKGCREWNKIADCYTHPPDKIINASGDLPHNHITSNLVYPGIHIIKINIIYIVRLVKKCSF